MYFSTILNRARVSLNRVRYIFNLFNVNKRVEARFCAGHISKYIAQTYLPLFNTMD